MSTMCRSDFWDGVVLHENDQRDAQEKKRLERDESIARLERDWNGKEVPPSGTEQGGAGISSETLRDAEQFIEQAERELRANHEWHTMIKEFYSSIGVPFSESCFGKPSVAEAYAILSSFPSASEEETGLWQVVDGIGRWKLIDAIGRLSAEGKRGFWARAAVHAQNMKREESGIDAQQMKREGEKIAYVGSDEFWRDLHSDDFWRDLHSDEFKAMMVFAELARLERAWK